MHGVHARRINLAQGRIALFVGERQASLVQLRPVIERFAGREIERGGAGRASRGDVRAGAASAFQQCSRPRRVRRTVDPPYIQAVDEIGGDSV